MSKYRNDIVKHTWHVLNVYRKRCLLINSISRPKQALKSPSFDAANFILYKAKGWLLHLSYGTESEDSRDFPNLELLKASAISGTERNTYGFEESAQY
jgi:hypothetical protein